MAVGDIGYGASVTYGTAVTVAQVMDISGHSPTLDSVEFTNNDSTDARREFKPGLIDEGELTISVVFDPTEYATTFAEFASRATTTWTITLPAGDLNAATFAGSAFITGLTTPVPMEDKLTSDITIKYTGAVTFTDPT